MASRRMFSLKVINSARFLKMPSSSQLLYFHLGLNADDDGVVEGYNIMRMISCTEDDLKILVAKGFIKVLNEDLVTYITDWREHNLIRSDRKIDSIYKKLLLQMVEEIKLLETRRRADLKSNKTQNIEENGQPVDNQLTPEGQHRLGKDRLGNDRLGKDRLDISTKVDCSSKLLPIVNKWNSLNLSKLINIKGNRLISLNARIKEYSLDDVMKAIESINYSAFLKGQNDRSWIITFDWFIKPNNFLKVLEGNYVDKEARQDGNNRPNKSGGKGKYADIKPKESERKPLTAKEIAELNLL